MDPGWIPVEGINTPLLEENRRFLRAFDPGLARRIEASAGDESLFVAKRDGLVCCRFEGPRGSGVLFGGAGPRAELRALEDELARLAEAGGWIVLPGTANGYLVELARKWLTARREIRMLAVEPSGARALAWMRFVDVRDLLNSGRFHLAVEPLDTEGLLRAADACNLWPAGEPRVFPSPGMETDAAPAEKTLRAAANERWSERAALIEGLKAAKPAGDALKAALLIDFWPGAVQSLHIRSVQRALAGAGVRTELLTFEGRRCDLMGDEYPRLRERELLNALDRLQPQLIVSYAYHAAHALAADVRESFPVPWLQVVTNLVHYDEEYLPYERTALIERGLAPDYQRRGAARVFHLPLVANYFAEEITPTDGSEALVFVGNPLGVGETASRALWIKWRARPRLFRYVTESERILGDFGRQTDIFSHFGREPVPDVESRREWFEVYRYLLCMGTEARRRQVLEAAAPLGLSVYGNWEGRLPPSSPLRPCLRGWLPMDREPALYSKARLFVNIHSAGHVTSPNMRFFNTAGMGAGQLTDGPFDSFLRDGEEAVYFRSVGEFAERARECLDHPGRLEEIRRRGLERVRNEWNYRTWLRRVCAELGFRLP